MVVSGSRGSHRAGNVEVVNILCAAVVPDEGSIARGCIGHNLEVLDAVALSVELAAVLVGTISHGFPRTVLKVDVGCEPSINIAIAVVNHECQPKQLASIIYLIVAFAIQSCRFVGSSVAGAEAVDVIMLVGSGRCNDDVWHIANRTSCKSVDDACSRHPKRRRTAAIEVDGIRHTEVLGQGNHVAHREAGSTLQASFHHHHVHRVVGTFANHRSRMWTIETFSADVGIHAPAVSSDNRSTNHEGFIRFAHCPILGIRGG